MYGDPVEVTGTPIRFPRGTGTSTTGPCRGDLEGEVGPLGAYGSEHFPCHADEASAHEGYATDGTASRSPDPALHHDGVELTWLGRLMTKATVAATSSAVSGVIPA